MDDRQMDEAAKRIVEDYEKFGDSIVNLHEQVASIDRAIIALEKDFHRIHDAVNNKLAQLDEEWTRRHQ